MSISVVYCLTHAHTNTRIRCHETALDCQFCPEAEDGESSMSWNWSAFVGVRDIQGVWCVLVFLLCVYASVCVCFCVWEKKRHTDRLGEKYQNLNYFWNERQGSPSIFFLVCCTNTNKTPKHACTHTPKIDMHDCQWYAVSIPLFTTIGNSNGT